MAKSLKTTKEKERKETMALLWEEIKDSFKVFSEGELIEVTVLTVTRSRIWVDVAGVTLGFIPEREYSSDVKQLKPGDKIMATVIALEDEQGYLVLSLKRAERERSLFSLKEKYDAGQTFPVQVVDANRGGLMVETCGVIGFLPVSQLAPLHYPKVGNNKEEILRRLQQFIGQTLNVKVINFDKSLNKLIFSEKAAISEIQEERAAQFKIGERLTATITGIVDFGLFVSLKDGLEGLVHISEVAWERVSDLKSRYKVGDKVEVMVLAIDRGKISLSIKRLLPDPWLEASKKYKVGDKIKGMVTRVTPFGAFVRINNEIDGLAHISELSDEKIIDPTAVVKTGKEYEFTIISIEPETHRVGLSFKKNPVIAQKASS